MLTEKEEIDNEMIEIRVNLDDLNPEIYTHIMDLLFKSGAKDVFLTPIIMKKGRPGLLLTVLSKSNLLNKIKEIIFKETSTLGLRYHSTTCHRLERSFQKVSTPWGELTVKIGYYQGEMVNFAPEFDQCTKLATENNIPLKQIYGYLKKEMLS